MSNEVKDKDNGWNGMMRRVLGAEGELTVGVHAEDGAKAANGGEGLTVLDVATFHEFGTSRVPRRSFINDWADENREKHADYFRKMAQAIIKGTVKDVDQALERLGLRFVGEIQRRMAQGIEPPLNPRTIQRKGSSKPLIDTGQLRSSITYVVNGKRGDVPDPGVREKAKAEESAKKKAARDEQRAKDKAQKAADREQAKADRQASKAKSKERAKAFKEAKRSAKLKARASAKAIKQAKKTAVRNVRSASKSLVRLFRKSSRTAAKLGKKTARAAKKTAKRVAKATRGKKSRGKKKR